MLLRMTLLSHGRTTARASAFAADEPLAEDVAERIGALVAALSDVDQVLVSPALAARQTAAAWSKNTAIEIGLADIDLSRWRGRLIRDVETAEPDALTAWMEDADFAGHGGESRAELMRRVAAWLDARRRSSGHILAVTHPAVIQAAVLCILDAPGSAFRSIDVAPLHALDIRSDGRRWAIRSFGRL